MTVNSFDESWKVLKITDMPVRILGLNAVSGGRYLDGEEQQMAGWQIGRIC